MRLQQFEIQGYKNLRSVVRLDDLGGFNVLHGDNNVGKSNLLESIGLLFSLLETIRDDVVGNVSRAESFARRSPPGEPSEAESVRYSTVRSFAYLAKRGFPPNEIFNLQDVQPIRIRASILLEPKDLSDGDPAHWTTPLEVTMRLERRENELLIVLANLQWADGTDVANEDATTLWRLLDLLGPSRRGEDLHPRFVLVRADRTVAGEPLPTGEGTAPLSTREALPPDLGIALYDAENATDPIVQRRFARFLKALEGFQDILGPGTWRMHYDRKAERAEPIFHGSAGRVPLRLMGSGIQQVVSLIARLVMIRADIVSLEEPELNLRYTTQLRLREVLSALVRDAAAPSQLLVTSHSGAFETEEMFYAMLRSPDGPRVERRHRRDAARFTHPEANVPPEGVRAPLSYVTSEGLVLIPEEVRKVLGLEHGGAVTFVPEKTAGHYRMLTDAQFLDMIEPREPSL
jgi:hypothetical protein